MLLHKENVYSEIAWLKEQRDKWKRAAKHFYRAWLATSSHPIEQEWNALVGNHCADIERADKAQAELAATKAELAELKEDAWLLALEDLQTACWDQQGNSYRVVISAKAKVAARRIIEATRDMEGQ